MDRSEKVKVIEEVREGLAAANAAFLVEFKGLTVAEMRVLRRELRPEGATMRVAKARLMLRASEGLAGMDGFRGSLNGQVALVLANADVPAVAKTLVNFAKNRETFLIRAGFFESKSLDVSAVTSLATLPSREELLAMLAGTLQAPIAGLARALDGVISGFARVLSGVAEKPKSEGS